MVGSQTTARYSCLILTSDPATGIIEANLKGDYRRISVVSTSVAWRWPVAGETWVVRQENGTWYLDSPYPVADLDTVDPGDVVINSPTGTIRVMGGLDGSTDFTLYKIPENPWTPLTFQNSWTNAFVNTPGEYFKDPLGFVHLRGRLSGGSSGTAAFLLPAGYRPGQGDDYAAAGYNNTGNTAVAAFLNVGTTGTGSIWFASGATDVGLGGITFLAEN